MRRQLYSAVRSVLESLESRQLLHGGFTAEINFQPSGATTPAGYLADTGSVYADRGNGFTYGWNADNSANTRDKNSSLSPDQRYDTFDHMQKNGAFSWEIAVPNGDYTVHIVTGDAGFTDSVFKINAEGVLTVSGTPTSSKHWVEGTKTVTVSDGKLTLSNAAGASNNKICFVDISAFDDHPVVEIAATTPNIFESGSTNGQFTITRSGSLTGPLSVDYIIGGSATNSDDYDTLSGNVIIPAGSDHAVIDVVPHNDSAVEGDETIMLTLSPSANYEVDADGGDATVTILGDDASTMGATFRQRINFQPDGVPVPDYYKADIGSPYSTHSNGLTYGWNGNNTGTTRDRDSSTSPDQRYDTLIHMQKAGDWKWEMAVPNGTYTVRIVSGDATAIDSVFKINVEGVLTVSGSPTSGNHWVEGTKTVTVKDGRLTISNGSGASNNKICFVEIAAGSFGVPVVKFAPADSVASEAGDHGQFAISRVGDLSQPLTVNYTIGGSATNGTDYEALSGSITIPAGQAMAALTVNPIQDNSAEGTENIVLTISPNSAYSLAQKFQYTINIADDDVDNTTPLGKLAWSTKQSSPQVRAEATGAVVGGKLYAFGGYKDSTYHPIARVDMYDPATNTWTRKGDMPIAATHMGTATDGTFVYFAGGYPAGSSGAQTFSTTTVRRYNPANDSWSTIQPLPSARGAGNLQYLNGKLYFFGGSDSSRKDRAEMFSLDLNNPNANWVQLASMPAARNHVGGAALGGFIYSIGGQQLQDANTIFKGDVWRYDPSTNKWATMASLPNQPRSHINGSTVVYKGHIIAMGGEGPGRVALNNVESYDPATNKWTSLSPLPSGRSSGIGGVFGDKLIFNGGYSGQFNAQTWIGTFS
jgi:N-acetylneuraminic acid mutarotase